MSRGLLVYFFFFAAGQSIPAFLLEVKKKVAMIFANLHGNNSILGAQDPLSCQRRFSTSKVASHPLGVTMRVLIFEKYDSFVA